MRRLSALLLVTFLLLSTGSVSTGVRSQGIQLEPLLRVSVDGPALSVAVDANRRRIYVADGRSLRPFVHLSPDTVVPAIAAPVPIAGHPRAIEAEGSDVFVATDDGVYRVDGLQHRLVGSITGFRAHGLQVEGEHVFVAAQDIPNNECGLYVLSPSLTTVDSLLDRCSVGDIFSATVSVAVDESYAYLGVMAGGGFTGAVEGFLHVADISQPDEPQKTGFQCSLAGLPIRMELVDGFAYSAEGADGHAPAQRPGLSIVDVAQPSQPHVVGHFETRSKLTGLAVSLPYAYATDGEGRVWAVDVSDPARPSLAAYYDTGFPAHDIAVGEPYLYVADGDGGLVILRIRTVAAPTPTPPLVVAEGTMTRAEQSVCQAGETHYLPESGVFLYSDFVRLESYEGRNVRVWGWSVDSPECDVLNVTAVELIIAPTSTLIRTPTATLTNTPTCAVTHSRIYLPVIRKDWA
jgi:hypothetical protein